MSKKPLPITGTGEETRDFTYVGDIVNGLLGMVHYDEAVGEAINLGTGREIRIKDLAKWVNELSESKSKTVFEERRNWDKKSRLLSSIDKARKILKYEPSIEFKDGLKHTHVWFMQNWEDIKRSAEF
jgi:nucleoside-diphosphate-sugar epimerase